MLNDQQLQNTLAKPSIAWLCRSAKACNCHFKSMTKFISFLVPFPYFLPCWRMGLLFWAIKILAKWFPSPDVKPRKIKLSLFFPVVLQPAGTDFKMKTMSAIRGWRQNNPLQDLKQAYDVLPRCLFRL